MSYLFVRVCLHSAHWFKASGDHTQQAHIEMTSCSLCHHYRPPHDTKVANALCFLILRWNTHTLSELVLFPSVWLGQFKFFKTVAFLFQLAYKAFFYYTFVCKCRTNRSIRPLSLSYTNFIYTVYANNLEHLDSIISKKLQEGHDHGYASHLISDVLLLLGCEDFHRAHQPHHQVIHCSVTCKDTHTHTHLTQLTKQNKIAYKHYFRIFLYCTIKQKGNSNPNPRVPARKTCNPAHSYNYSNQPIMQQRCNK